MRGIQSGSSVHGGHSRLIRPSHQVIVLRECHDYSNVGYFCIECPRHRIIKSSI